MRDLRDAWRSMDVPDAANAPESYEDADPRTSASVEWMRTAWQDLEIPAVRVPKRAPILRPSFARRAAFPIAIGAAVLVLAAAWLLFPNEQAGVEVETEVAEIPPWNEPELLSVGSNNIELRSGNVTLVLVTSES